MTACNSTCMSWFAGIRSTAYTHTIKKVDRCAQSKGKKGLGSETCVTVHLAFPAVKRLETSAQYAVMWALSDQYIALRQRPSAPTCSRQTMCKRDCNTRFANLACISKCHSSSTRSWALQLNMGTCSMIVQLAHNFQLDCLSRSHSGQARPH